jgi:hypothetical protein
MSFTNPQKKKKTKESHLENKSSGKWVSFFLSNYQETPSPERHEHDGRSEIFKTFSRPFIHISNGSEKWVILEI